MKAIKSILLCSIILMVLSCGPRVQTVKPMDTDLSKYKTFAYLPNFNTEVPGKNYNDENVNTLIIETINKSMREAGYTLDRENPDLLVLVSTRTNTQTETRAEPMYARYPYTGAATTVSPFYNNYYYRGYNAYTGIIGYNTDTYTYEEGTVVIDLVDRETKETVWKGISSENLYDETTTGAMRDLVNQIFEEYPLNN